jgi:hypothetical protein
MDTTAGLFKRLLALSYTHASVKNRGYLEIVVFVSWQGTTFFNRMHSRPIPTFRGLKNTRTLPWDERYAFRMDTM